MAIDRGTGGRRAAGVEAGVEAGRRRARRIVAAVMLVALVATSAAIFGPSFLVHRREAVATAKAWTLKGAPCQALTPAAYARQWFKATKGFAWDGVLFGRGAGHADCQDVTYGGGKGFGVFPVCQFTSPQVIAVTVEGRTSYFTPGLGKGATVAVPHGKPGCVVASNFTLGG